MTHLFKKFGQINNSWETFQIIFLIGLSAFFIFYKFNQIPKNISFDEVEFAKLALSLEDKPYTPYSPQATGHSTLYFYILLFSFKIFGVNNFALRLPAAFFGILNILFFYLIIKKIFDKQPIFLPHKAFNFPFLLSTIFLTSHWYLNFARFAFEATFLLFLELTSIYFLIKTAYLEKSSLILSGIFAGLAFNSYAPGRIFFLLPLFFLTFKLANSLIYKQNKIFINQFLYFFIPLLIVITPLSLYLFRNKDIRLEQQFFWKNHQLSLTQKIDFTWQNIKSTALMFHFKGDINGRHNYPGKPALNPILGLLFVAGFFITLKNYKYIYSLLFIIYFFLSLLPTLMTYPWENPNMLRTFTAIPSVIYFIGVALIHLINFFKNKKLLLFILYSLLIFSCFYELRTYFKYQKKVFNEAFQIQQPLEKAIKMKNLYEK